VLYVIAVAAALFCYPMVEDVERNERMANRITMGYGWGTVSYDTFILFDLI
jgi:hypothetical protein